MTRRIGRRDSDASPTSVAENGWPASTPASSRIVVPELPASSGAGTANGVARNLVPVE